MRKWAGSPPRRSCVTSPRQVLHRPGDRASVPPMPLDDVRIVLVRPRGSANVGAVARAMKNMGLARLVLVAPRLEADGWAEAMAVHGRDVLAAATTAATLAEAVAGCRLVVGTAARSGPFAGQTGCPRALAPEILAVARSAPVALVFGPEDHGLSNDDLKACQRLVTIPTADAYASLNLAQAVLVCAYELHLAATAAAATAAPALPPDLAPAEQVGLLLERLETALLAIGFLNPQNPDPVMYVFRRVFARAGLGEHDVRVLLGLARQIAWAAAEAGRSGAGGKV